MRKYLLFFISAWALLLVILAHSKTQQAKANLSAQEFAKRISEAQDATVLDVRTAEEFAKGHLVNAKNIDWNGPDFDKRVAALDKSRPVFVYCLSGGRSAKAAASMRTDGFMDVYELSGGIMKWRAAGLPETTNSRSLSAGMTIQQFDQLLDTDKFVLVDFYAEWCPPCKKMKPYLEEISKEMGSAVLLVRINADDNQVICKELKVDALPVLQLYKNKVLTWSHSGYIEKAEVVKQLQ